MSKRCYMCLNSLHFVSGCFTSFCMSYEPRSAPCRGFCAERARLFAVRNRAMACGVFRRRRPKNSGLIGLGEIPLEYVVDPKSCRVDLGPHFSHFGPAPRKKTSPCVLHAKDYVNAMFGWICSCGQRKSWQATTGDSSSDQSYWSAISVLLVARSAQLTAAKRNENPNSIELPSRCRWNENPVRMATANGGLYG